MAAPKRNTFYKARSKHGRAKLYPSPEELLQAAYSYFEWCDTHPWIKVEQAKHQAKPYNDEKGKVQIQSKLLKLPTQRPYTLKGLYLFLKIDRKTWKLYQKREDFIPITTRVCDIIYTQKLEGAAVGAFNANIIARDLKLRKTIVS
jgi:hypothetical protein